MYFLILEDEEQEALFKAKGFVDAKVETMECGWKLVSDADADPNTTRSIEKVLNIVR